MNFKNIAMIAGVAFSSLFFASQAQANVFVESDTKANLIGGGDDSVLTVVRVGKQDGDLSYGVGVGYNSNGDEAVINSLVEYATRLSDSVVLGAEVELTYGLGSDKLIAEPQLRVRKYL